jgi:glutamine amidotransferase PdxT
MDAKVKRNAFGRQRESFEVLLKMSLFEEPFHAVFIRAPAILAIQINLLPFMQNIHPQLCKIPFYLYLEAHPTKYLLKFHFNEALWDIRT